MAKKLLIIIVIILIVALVVLAIVFINPKKEGEVEEVKEAEEKVEPEEKGPAITEEIYGLSGEIKEVYLDRILLVEAKILLADPRKEPIKQIVKIKVTDETRILKLKFPEEIPEGSIEPIFPEKTEISFGDLKVGDKIDIEIPDNVYEKIINKLEIVASTSIISVIE
jgi:hypothetical protein